ncbi:hypothetical protein BDD14_2098 [Edaphobacter modestus]|uniref:Uncharacterized protein n=1 Tax=Edaphobacter modestus TaxID=388466 RepID=A0A4Q7YST0_9BACT|nr:hypothetical protein BDD14_2098 [Edaphobacter modestus]
MKASTMGETVANRGGQALHRGCSNFRDNRYNHNSYLEEADMSS